MKRENIDHQKYYRRETMCRTFEGEDKVYAPLPMKERKAKTEEGY